MLDTYSDKGWNVGNPSLPIHFIAGADDPCITSRKDFEKAVGHIRSVGYAKVTSKLYEGMRHEILNETDRMKVWNDVLETLDSWAE
jgi:alpha-beta hydrolase superfamily lysophospholipase